MANLSEMTSTDPVDDNKNYLELLVGEGKKFATVEDLAKSSIHGETHIKTLEEENKELRAVDDKLNGFVKQLTEAQPLTRTENSDPAANVQSASSETKVSAEEVKAMVTQAISDQQTVAEAERNTDTLFKRLVEHYKDDREARLAIGRAIGKDSKTKELIDLAGKTNPDLAFRMITSTPLADNASIPFIDGEHNPPQNRAFTGLTWTQARDIRKKDPKRYNSPAFRAELEKATMDCIALKIDYFST